MPRPRGRGRNYGRRTSHTQIVHDQRLNKALDDHLTDNENVRSQVANRPANENKHSHLLIVFNAWYQSNIFANLFEEHQIKICCEQNHIEQMREREIEAILETFMQNHNQLVQLFKTVSKRLENDSYMIVIKPDKVPYGEHPGR